MKEGSKSTIAALAAGGGLLAIIALVESRRARVGAPVITKGAGATGRWTQARTFVGFDPIESIAELTDSIAGAVGDAVDASGLAGSSDERSALINEVLRAAFNQAARKDPTA